MSHAAKGGRETAGGLAEEHSPASLEETEADCMEEAAFQLGLPCLEGLKRRKGIAGGSEGGGEHGAQLWGASGPWPLSSPHGTAGGVPPHR